MSDGKVDRGFLDKDGNLPDGIASPASSAKRDVMVTIKIDSEHLEVIEKMRASLDNLNATLERKEKAEERARYTRKAR